MDDERKNKLTVIGIALICLALLIFSFYSHRNEPHWFETKYVKIIK
jgi:hypothetical protein